MPLVWFVLSFKGIRQGPLFAITAAVAIADLWPHTVWHRLLVKYGDGSLAWNPETTRPAAAARGSLWCDHPRGGRAASLRAAGRRASPVPVVGRGWARLDPDFVPADLTDAVRAVRRERAAGHAASSTTRTSAAT